MKGFLLLFLLYSTVTFIILQGWGHCLVIADPINSSFIACWDVNSGNKPRGLDMLMCPETCLENFCFSAVYINMINDHTTEKSIFKSSFHSLGFFVW